MPAFDTLAKPFSWEEIRLVCNFSMRRVLGAMGGLSALAEAYHKSGQDAHGTSVPQPMWALAIVPQVGHVPAWGRSVAGGSPEFADVPVGRVGMHGSETAHAGVTWTSPIDGSIDVSGDVWLARKTLGRSMHWNLLINGSPLTGGDLTSDDAFTSASPFDLADGSSGAGALTMPVSVGDVLTLELFKLSSSAEFAGVDLSVSATPVPAPSALVGLASMSAAGLLLARRPMIDNPGPLDQTPG